MGSFTEDAAWSLVCHCCGALVNCPRSSVSILVVYPPWTKVMSLVASKNLLKFTEAIRRAYPEFTTTRDALTDRRDRQSTWFNNIQDLFLSSMFTFFGTLPSACCLLCVNDVWEHTGRLLALFCKWRRSGDTQRCTKQTIIEYEAAGDKAETKLGYCIVTTWGVLPSMTSTTSRHYDYISKRTKPKQEYLSRWQDVRFSWRVSTGRSSRFKFSLPSCNEFSTFIFGTQDKNFRNMINHSLDQGIK